MAKLFQLVLLFFFVGNVSGCISINLLPQTGPLQETTLSGAGEDKVLLIDVSGVLNSSEPSGIIDRPSLPSRLKEELTKAMEDSQIKALVLRINSPGGTVTASDILHHEIRQFKEQRDIPIIVSLMDVGTSGGYYLAVAGDKIVAHPSTITGSIGVIMVTLNAQGLLEKIGVEPTAIVSGPKKAMGSPFRTMTDEERSIFQSVIDSLFDRFVTVVNDGRPGLDKQAVRRLADGRIYSADQAKKLGLVDEVGYLDDALELAKSEAGIQKASIVTYYRSGGYKQNIYSQFAGKSDRLAGLSALDPSALMALLSGGTPQLMYLWMP